MAGAAARAEAAGGQRRSREVGEQQQELPANFQGLEGVHGSDHLDDRLADWIEWIEFLSGQDSQFQLWANAIG